MGMALEMPGPDAAPEQIVETLRLRALAAVIFAEVTNDPGKAVEARDIAHRLRCQAARIEDLSALYEQLGRQARFWEEFEGKLRTLFPPR
jgi:hypothetical protein